MISIVDPQTLTSLLRPTVYVPTSTPSTARTDVTKLEAEASHPTEARRPVAAGVEYGARGRT